MKKQLLLVIALILGGNLSAQKNETVLEIDGKKVTQAEFLQVYLKNNKDPKYDKQSLDEYMELFRKFKLKVAEAEALGYDTIPKLKKELEGYRKQLAQPYLIDANKSSELVKDSYERIKSEIRASHILIRVEESANPEDTLKAYNRIMELRKRILNGEDFGTIAKSKGGSEDPSAQTNNGDLGYFTAFQMVFPFEDAAYKAKVGDITMPVRTRFGYHILKIVDKRASRGTMRAAHIVVSLNAQDSPEEVAASEKKANEIYARLMKGESFEALAKEFSDDSRTAEKGGELGTFGYNGKERMIPQFEDVAFALENNGDISKPIKLASGIFIIKRLELMPIPSFDDSKKEIQQKVNKDERAKITQQYFIEGLKNQYGFSDKYKKTSKWFVKSIDSNYFYNKWDAKKLKSNKTMFTIGDAKFTQKQFADYLVKNYRSVKKMDNNSLIKKQYANWQAAEILGFEDKKLEGKYPEFKALMQEYHDGILLFEVMTDKVWNKAIKDTNGLKEYFAQNNSKYVWGKRYDAYVYECKDAKIAADVATMLKNDTISSKTIIGVINKDSELNLKVKTNKFEAENTPFMKDRTFTKGVNPMYEMNGKFYVVKVNDILPSGTKVLSEAKGAATSDYQNYLEKIWLEELAIKHPIKVNSAALYSINN